MPANTRGRTARGGANGNRRAFQERVAELERLLAAQRAQVEERLFAQREELEGRLADQEQRFTAQQEEIERLRAGRAEAAPASPPILPARLDGLAADETVAEPRRSSGRRASRRALLRWSGAAAAAGVAAGAVGLWRPASARAAGARADQTITVTSADFDSASRKFTAFLQGLPPGEQGVFEGVLELAAQVSPWWGPVRGPRYRPRGAKMLVFGGSDGLTVLLGGRGFVVVHPEGPLPTDLTQFLSASVVLGA